MTPIGLAHWIQGDGYFSNGSVYICTDNFTLNEVKTLIDILNQKFGLKAGTIKRVKDNGKICHRIRISSLSTQHLRDLVSPYIIPEMLYKLGL